MILRRFCVAASKAGTLPLDKPVASVLVLYRMRLCDVLRKWRRVSDLGVREAAKQIGLNAATYSRVERGHPMDGATFVRIFRWLTEAK